MLRFDEEAQAEKDIQGELAGLLQKHRHLLILGKPGDDAIAYPSETKALQQFLVASVCTAS